MILFAWISCAVAAAFIGRTVRDTLFLAHEGPARLPIMYIASPLSTAAVGVGYGKLVSRLSRERLVPVTALTFAMLGLVLRFSVGATWMYYALYIVTDCAAAIMPMLFWLNAGDRFSPREAKRLFSLFGAAGTASTVIVGIVVAWLVKRTGADDLLFGYAALLAVVAGLALALARRPTGHAAAASRPRAHAPDKPAPGASHLRLLAPLLVLGILVTTLLDFQFKTITAETYANDRAGMASFFSMFYVATAASSLAIQLLLARRIIAHYGIAGALLVMPAGLGLAAGALLVAPSLITATACKAAQMTFRPSVNDAGMQLLYLPVPASERARRKTKLDSVVGPTAEGTVGLALFAYRALVGIRAPLVVAALIAVTMWIAVVLRMRVAYVRAIAETLRRRRIDPEGVDVRLANEDIRALREALTSGDGDVVRRGLDLARMDPSAVVTEVRALLAHRDPAVRAEALACLAETAGLDDESLSTALTDADPAVRAMAARAFATCGSDELQTTVAPMLADADPQIASAALESMYARGDAARRAHIVERVAALLASADRRSRRRGLDVASAIADPALAPALVERLADRRDAPAAEIALAAIGPEVVATLDAAIAGDDAARTAGALAALGRVAAAHPSDVPIDRLVAALADKREACRDAAAAAFAPLRRAGVKLPVEPLVDACRAELQRAFNAMATADGLGNAESVMNLDGTRVAVPYVPDAAAGPAALISRALRERAERAQARMFELLAALEPELDLPTVRANLRDPDPVRRANAVELLDAKRWPEAIAPLKQLALCVVDDASRAAKLAAASKRIQLPRFSRDGWIDKLLSDRAPFIRACAAFYAGALRDAGARARLDELCADADPFVSETARAALRALDRLPEDDMLTVAEKVLFLKGAELFAQIPGEDVAAIAAVAEEVRFDESETIFKAGDPGEALYLIVEGNVRIANSERTLAELGCREVFGEMALLDPAPRSATATAAAPVVALTLGQDDFKDVLAQRPEVAAGVLRVVVRRLRTAQGGQ